MKVIHGGNTQEMAELYQIDPDQLIDFSANLNPLGICPKIKTELIAHFDQVAQYPDIRYSKLTEKLADHHGLLPQQIFLGNGAADVIYALAQVLQVKSLLLLAPTFMEYEAAFSLTETKFFYYKLEETGFKLVLGDFLEAIEKQRPAAICICNPNNPTGFLVEQDEMRELVAFCQVRGIKCVVDEAFMDFVPAERGSLISECQNFANLYIVRSLTKIFAIPGLRLGYLLTSDEQVQKALKQRSVPWRINYFADLAGQLALSETEYLAESVSFVAAQRRYLVSELSQFKDIEVYESQTNFLFFGYTGSLDLRQRLLEKKLLIRETQSFRGLTKRYYRIAVRTKVENEKLVQAIRGLLAEK